MQVRSTPLTPRRLIELKASLALYCDACRLMREADPNALVAAGRGDQPVAAMRFRCTTCAQLRRETKVKAQATWWCGGTTYDYDFATGELRLR